MPAVWETGPSCKLLEKVNVRFTFLQGPLARCIQTLKWRHSFFEIVKLKLESKSVSSGIGLPGPGEGQAGRPGLPGGDNV